MTSTCPMGTLDSVASLLAATLYKEILIGTASSGISINWPIYTPYVGYITLINTRLCNIT